MRHMLHKLHKLFTTALLDVMVVSLAALPLNGTNQADHSAYAIGQIPPQAWKQPLSQRQRAELLISRTTFGARPGDVDRVLEMGLNKFLNQQLHPQALDDSALEAKLQALQTLSMSPEELAEDYPPPMQAKRREQRRLAALERADSRNQSLGVSNEGQNVDARQVAEQTPTQIPNQTSGEASDQMQHSADALGERRGESGPAVMTQAPGPGANQDSAQPANGQQAFQGRKGPQEPQGPRAILMQLSQEEMLRAVYSQRQLQEVMVHFWMNHFNVYWPKGADRYYLTSFEQNVIRPHALGNFEDLLVATAESPATLFYLDNWMSVSPEATDRPNPRPAAFRPVGPGQMGLFRPFGPARFPQRAKQAKKANNRRGLNENYGRELMELHTIGLNYTQQDVTEVARCFTGWTLQRPGQGGGFYFNPRLHDYGKKVVLGYTIPAGQGIEDGFEVLHILAMNPHTADHIAYELCQRFVADNPPPDLVARASKTYLATQGDIASVLKAILTSPEFYSKGAYRAKVKTPFEYVASALRALDADTDGGQALYGMMSQMGEPMFMYEAPSGWDDVARTWVNSSALLARMNFALGLCAGRIPGTKVNWQSLARAGSGDSPRQTIKQVAEQLTDTPLPNAAGNAILEKMAEDDPAVWGQLQPGQETRLIAGLVLGSPEFQKR